MYNVGIYIKGIDMKKLFVIFLLIGVFLFGNQYKVLKIQDRVTNELVEKSEKDFQEYKEWLEEEDKKFLEAEKNNPSHSKTSPRLNNPNISYEEYREKGYLGNWLIWQVDIEDTIWGKLITVPSSGSKECYGKHIENKKQRLDFIKETSRGYKILPDEWISSLELQYINSACNINSSIIGPNKDKNKLRAEVERIEKINAGLAKDTTDVDEFLKGLILAFFMFVFLWFIAFGVKGFNFWAKKEKSQDTENYSFFNYMMYKWWFK